MKIVRYDLFITGIVSAASNELVAKGLKRNFDENSSLCLFCGYANYNIPIGTEVNCLANLQTEKDEPIKATLIDITQQWAIPFDLIPSGWQTVARFMFSKEDLNFIKNEIPFIDTWSDSKNKFKLIAYDSE